MGAYIIPISAASLLLIVVAIIVLRHALTPRITAPLCGYCRYDVTGLPTEICPECGANLHVVGVLRPGSARPMGRVMKVSLWTLSVAAIGVIATPPILRSIPPLQQVTTTATLARPATRLYESVTIDGTRSWRGNDTVARSTVDVALMRLDRQRFTMHGSPERGLCWYTDARGKTARGRIPSDDEDLAARTVLEWMNACDIAASDETLLAEAREIARSIRQAGGEETTPIRVGGRMMIGSMSSQMRGFSFGSSSGYSSSARGFSLGMPFSSTSVQLSSGMPNDPWPQRLVIGGWVAVWLLGAGVIVLLGARRLPNQPAPEKVVRDGGLQSAAPV
jgi:hypothetical protein